ncbi:MAG TPA: hypothetical protein PLQ89_10770 [Phycisphaerae bacterium]|nr:hypothetical protein [Phycisphaerae bacterium]HOM53340.1 hypothetical protein [Phycisphaerae bacterium]HOQ86193.1 hypothetical protein [Phycisphaerae bacterium]HPP28530.1 hypothetical protein [Phycisphaerae bacterium]HPU26255.1 hypothetical protein [Phycisphaerae bacterium]
MRHTRYMWAVCTMATLATALPSGCSQVSRPEQAQAGERVGPDQFLHEHLQRQAVVTVSEAYRAMVMLAEGDDRFDSFAAREEYLLAKKIVRPEWKLKRDAAIDRGSVAYMVLQILDLRGGVNMNVYGRMLGVADRRYAVRELAYKGIMVNRPPYRLITGPELVDVLARADTYMAENGRYDEPPTSVVEQVEAADAP